MKIFIVEDEDPALQRIKKLLGKIDPGIQITGEAVSVKNAVAWLQKNPAPDLILMDIQLADGESFEIFSEVQVKSPVIFITAFDQHAVRAFKLNSIDYLLKPVKEEELANAIIKYKTLYAGQKNVPVDYEKLLEALKAGRKEFQKRIIIRFGETIKTIEIDDVAYFYTQDKINFLRTRGALDYPIDMTLDETEKILDPAKFFRINRQCIVSISAIQKMLVVSKSRVKLTLIPPSSIETIVSTERSSNFKDWLEGKS
jgi:DNA-binding LytR/AlgR family response regulator